MLINLIIYQSFKKLRVVFFMSVNYQCCCVIDNETIIIGTTSGKVLLRRFIGIDGILNVDFQDNIFRSVLQESYIELLDLNGVIRSIQRINEQEIVILSHLGGIVIYNIQTNQKQLVCEESYSLKSRKWRLLVIDESTFITLGSYGKIAIWCQVNSGFECRTFYYSKHSSFCINWIDSEEKTLIINHYDGDSYVFQLENSELIILDNFYLDSNLQKAQVFENYLIVVDYYGSVSIYNISENYNKVTEFQIDYSTGNCTQTSQEIEKILIGTDNKLILLSKNFQDVLELDICTKQIIPFNEIDLLLTDNDIIRVNYSKAQAPFQIKDYKFKKIALVGNSQTGKTSFCMYLETGDGNAQFSTFGTHLWSIPFVSNGNSSHDERRVLYLDLAGQEEEHFTYFPKIYKYDVILLFFQGNRPDSFNDAIRYYSELKEKCKSAQFYFIMTYSDQMQRILDSTIKREFDKFEIDFNFQLIKLDNSSGNGFAEYKEKILEKLEWEATPITYRVPIFDEIESIIHTFYLNSIEQLNLVELRDPTNLDEERLEKIILSYYEQGYIDYVKSEKLILINHERYTQIQSLVANVIVQNYGYASKQQIYQEVMNEPNDSKFIRNILNYYRDNKIGAIFKESDPNKEIFIFPRKLSEQIIIDESFTPNMPKNYTMIKYKSFKLEMEKIISFLSNFSLTLEEISEDEILLSRDGSNSTALLYIKINKSTNTEDVLFCSLGINKKEKIDKDIEDELITFFWDALKDNLTDFSIIEPESSVIGSSESDREVLIKFLNYSCERPYLDFKKEVILNSKTQKAEFIKDIIALTNMAYLNGNISYLIIGIEEKNCEIKSFNGIEHYDILKQQISQVIEENIDFAPNIEPIPFKIYDLFTIQQNNEISEDITFKEIHTDKSNQEKIMLLKFHRIPNRVCDLKDDFTFQNKRGRPDKYDRGISWMRIGSHTYKINEQHRIFLREK